MKVADHEEFATCGSDGQYALLIETHRDFMSPKSNLYTIQAFVSRSTTTATDEYTTVYGRPGDTVQVRPLVLLTITDEEKGF